MAAAFDPAAIEPGWSKRWREARLFVADAASPKPKFSITIPPPNVTGELHLGHATIITIQDGWSRYRRMTGYEVLWLPGTDHAAIATQNVIEKQLAQRGTTKEELGREAFDELVAEWYATVGGTIISQFAVLGASLDTTRLRFTMDEAYVRAVRTAFVRYYEKGWLYRGPRIVNWCPRCLSAISDLEVDWQTHLDTLYFIRYEVEEGDDPITIATVRPETILADSGVAVHPDDDRYRHQVGRHAILPLVGRRLPIVADGAVRREFGTGALKVTPGHDPLDHEIGERHHLALINGMSPDGSMNVPDLPRYNGLPAREARTLVVADLEAAGALVRSEPYSHEVGHCDRCGTVLEPLVSEQWFLRMEELAAMSIRASEQGRVRWHPERYERTYLDWLRGIRDWCVSRQLWLGHRIPVYYCGEGHQFASVDPPADCARCGSRELREDTDVLDTWFSSALWPFATLGWPEETADLAAFYPTDLETTDRGIINLWVTRMIFSGLFFMSEVPFRDVVIQATIQAADGRRMSKSLGTGIDPRDTIARYGADALRAWAAGAAMSGQDVRYDESRIKSFRAFGNKLWNATRLILMSPGGPPTARRSDHAEDRWIISRLQDAVRQATDGIEGYAMQRSVDGLFEFGWHEFCDWYLEAAKARLRAGDPSAVGTALEVLDTLLRLLHPFMPFITEELWHRLPGERDFLVRTRWPEPDGALIDAQLEAAFGDLRRLVEDVRAARQAGRAGSSGGRLWIGAPLLAGEPAGVAERLVADLARVEVVDRPVPGSQPLAWGEASLELPALPQSKEPRAGNSQAELARLEAELARVTAKLADDAFRSRAPAAIVAKEEGKAADLQAAIQRIREA